MTDPIQKTVHVPLSPDQAFDLFTEDMASWWPLDSHSLSAGDGTTARDVTVEPGKGGKIIETRPDGQTAPWATVTEWAPGARLALDWYVGRDPSEATQITVTFTAEGSGTRVDLTHGGFEVLASAASGIMAGYQTGWDHVFGACYRNACQSRADSKVSAVM
ncbi:hypothetical protein E2K80_00295 [Rhodophyticola sp. CCM32]|uniref:SRPBCC domain-containing protein n=1 Tax=Rhodophyticola sp. CCM32 TaxID=2916397 RepID=UPI00107F3823|nr:SRPBCC domain-containing protein [Rhodophyticola sp. CCM32]QBX99360.1 hypothetical protein E2K80_00295 [Rhodophyticola sp. CCM32]